MQPNLYAYATGGSISNHGSLRFQVDIDVTVINGGPAGTGAFDTALVWYTDNQYTFGGVDNANQHVNLTLPVASGFSGTYQSAQTDFAGVGTYYFSVVADYGNVVTEWKETDNTTKLFRIEITSPQQATLSMQEYGWHSGWNLGWSFGWTQGWHVGWYNGWGYGWMVGNYHDGTGWTYGWHKGWNVGWHNGWNYGWHEAWHVGWMISPYHGWGWTTLGTAIELGA
ncbi:MAG: CARDB domain-containing protein [Pseudomonadota bacterium]